MSWWLVALIIIAAFMLYDFTVGRKERKQHHENEKQIFRQIRMKQQRSREEELSKLNPADEHVAQRIKKLFYSASYHESRNLKAFRNVLQELSHLRSEILNSGGKERMKTITDRVEYLCGNDMRGFYEYLAILTHVEEKSGIN